MDPGPLVLVVDDFTDAREMYGDLLRFHGYRTEEAVDGVEAVQKAKKLRPAVILMDLAIPKMDGLRATRMLKVDLLTRKIPIIAVTAYGMPSDEERARRAGCDALVVKPVDPQQILAVIRRALAQIA